MKAVLMVMHARSIPSVLAAIASLKIPKVWFKGFTETQLATEIPRFIGSTRFDRYVLFGDDSIPTQAALDKILVASERLEAVTGWANLSPSVPLATVSLVPNPPWHRITKSLPAFVGHGVRVLKDRGVPPLAQVHGGVVRLTFPPIETIRRQPPIFRTYFVSWSLTSLSRRLWLEHPFRYPVGLGSSYGSDVAMSDDLNDAEVKMWCCRDAFVYHLHSKQGFLVGKVKPEVIIEA
ncbi:MAG: hypothetical protein KGI71_04545 [Patescibacteria group bacterium]|nr:hypothetical protein [Patescibacteria group bacterium]